jgi:DNA-binding NarL/FixJ family response regulator
MPKPRVLLGDDHPLIVEGLRSLLRDSFDIVGAAYDGRQLVSEAARLAPDAVLLDISMPLLNGIEAARQIKTSLPSTKLLFITQTGDREFIQMALQLGASAYLLKQAIPSEVVAALQKALEGGCYISAALNEGMSSDLSALNQNVTDRFTVRLSPRQREVLQLVAEGKSNKEIAAILNISVKTVEFHKAGIMQELGLRTTAELTRYAIQHGIA